MASRYRFRTPVDDFSACSPSQETINATYAETSRMWGDPPKIFTTLLRVFGTSETFEVSQDCIVFPATNRHLAAFLANKTARHELRNDPLPE